MSKKSKGSTKAAPSPEAIEKMTGPVYDPPRITSYSSEEILEQVGPAQACSPAPCGIF